MPPAKRHRHGSTRGPLRKLLLLSSLAYVGAIPFDEIALFSGRSISAVLGLIVLLVWGFWFIAERAHEDPKLHWEGNRSRRFLWAALFSYGMWLVLSTSWSQYSEAPSARLATVLALILLVPALSIGLAGEGRATIDVFVSTSTVVAVLILAGVSDTSRSTAASLDLNTASLYLTVAFGCALRESLTTSGTRRIASGIAVFLLCAGALSTGSRTGLVALVMVAVVAVLSSTSRGMRLRRMITGTLALGLFGLLTWASSGYLPSRLWGTVQDVQLGDLSSRIELWSTIWFYRDSWLPWGIGPGATTEFTGLIFDRALVAHNTFLTTAVESGVIGLALFLLILFAAARSALWSPYRRYLVVAAVPTLVFMSMLSLEYDKLIWFLVALAASRWPRTVPSDAVARDGRDRAAHASAVSSALAFDTAASQAAAEGSIARPG
jgi:hypothetical protein